MTNDSIHNFQQTTSHILMIRPVRFAFNEQTAESNAFQDATATEDPETIQSKALREFDMMVDNLRGFGIDVTVIEDTPDPHTPDAIFPNNWISFHQAGSGTIYLYPMQAHNRRLERRMDIIEILKRRFHISQIVDLSHFESEDKFLEGTGSLVLDRDYRIAYACLSPRTHEELLKEFAQKMDYRVVSFHATDEHNKPIYHTNVIMCIGEQFAVICLECIQDEKERYHVRKTLEETNKEIIELSIEQVNRFAGNMLQLRSRKGERLLVMSTQAYQALLPDQLRRLEKYTQITYTNLNTIERNGGGSARCMIAEVHLSPL
ncbi:arginine deiminase-related protein [Cytophagaceae bacterium DM2B3-1]|uniref:Arginine deiminase-related protein n=1 Tax=Xanthocytophaga flava TaxID=3048013 RepID=A0ABT7CUZ9_9BACT|nr:arginine deiminase-related protein [Xanthocytophaga flavus]MDJ1469186.1 arginine deiminase-related protein [Xanthocytophaga flavus]MDJ1497558.1 arginine deiminase-related protein [Xanthocytophaga flavus]